MTDSAKIAPAQAIEVYWVPGCSSCLRMKEFIERTGFEFESVNLADAPGRTAKLDRIGVSAPAVAVLAELDVDQRLSGQQTCLMRLRCIMAQAPQIHACGKHA